MKTPKNMGVAKLRDQRVAAKSSYPLIRYAAFLQIIKIPQPPIIKIS